MIKIKHIIVGVFAIYLYYRSRPATKYVQYVEEPVNFEPPKPIDQSQLYRTVEEVERLDVKGTGSIPSWLSGTLLRDGPGLFEFGDFSARHAFDGMALIRRYSTTGNSSLDYSRKFIKSDVLKANRAEQRYTKPMVGTVPEGTILDRMRFLSEPPGDNMVVNTLTLHKRYYAATELAQVIEYDPDTLETLGKVDLTPIIPGIKFMTPHPLYDKDGTMWNIAMCTGPTRDGRMEGLWRYVLFKVPPPKTLGEDPWINLEIVAELPSSRLISISYLHSFFMTERYLIFTEQPWIIGDITLIIYNYIIQGLPLGSLMYYDSSAILKFHVLDKVSGEFLPLTYEADPMGFFHIFNAYEDDGFLVLDAPFKSTPISYDVFRIAELSSSPEQLAEYMKQKGPAAGLSKRWILPTKVQEFQEPETVRTTPAGEIDQSSFQQIVPESMGKARAWLVKNRTVYLHPELLAPTSDYTVHRALEFAAYNPKYQYQKYKYVYGLGFPTGYLAGSIGRLNVVTKRIEGWWEDQSCRATEPQFVPDPSGTMEQDGVLITACLSTGEEETHLVVLDPATFTELGRFTVPTRTPIGFHGVWISK